jgi:hypothetical protein
MFPMHEIPLFSFHVWDVVEEGAARRKVEELGRLGAMWFQWLSGFKKKKKSKRMCHEESIIVAGSLLASGACTR